MNTPETYNIAMPNRTKDSLRIHRFDYREGYVKWCAVCASRNDDTTNDDHDNEDHPFETIPSKAMGLCTTCDKGIDPNFHTGVYITRVSYAAYCSPMCAYEHNAEEF